MKREIDAYIVWSAKHGYDFDIGISSIPNHSCFEDVSSIAEIKPVYLVDASPEGKEAVVPKELVMLCREIAEIPLESPTLDKLRELLTAVYPKVEK